MGVISGEGESAGGGLCGVVEEEEIEGGGFAECDAGAALLGAGADGCGACR